MFRKAFMLTTALGLAISGAFLGATSKNASAETRWEHNHPRRDQVNDRLERQNARIRQERREGEITPAQARRLHQEHRAIRQEERNMAQLSGGHITRAEQRALNQQENTVGRKIGR